MYVHVIATDLHHSCLCQMPIVHDSTFSQHLAALCYIQVVRCIVHCLLLAILVVMFVCEVVVFSIKEVLPLVRFELTTFRL